MAGTGSSCNAAGSKWRDRREIQSDEENRGAVVGRTVARRLGGKIPPGVGFQVRDFFIPHGFERLGSALTTGLVSLVTGRPPLTSVFLSTTCLLDRDAATLP